VASGKALVVLHWALRSVSHRCTAMAIEIDLIAVTAYFDCCNRS
jgi:hypothetical protein